MILVSSAALLGAVWAGTSFLVAFLGLLTVAGQPSDIPEWDYLWVLLACGVASVLSIGLFAACAATLLDRKPVAVRLLPGWALLAIGGVFGVLVLISLGADILVAERPFLLAFLIRSRVELVVLAAVAVGLATANKVGARKPGE